MLEGRYARLEPLSAAAHRDGLFTASAVPGANAKFAWLYEYPPTGREDFLAWVEQAERSTDPLFFAVIDKVSGQVAGRQSLMRIDPVNGVIEIGNIYWGPLISRRPAATEAQFLFMNYVFDELGYRRYEWKRNNRNEPQSALRSALAFSPKAFSASTSSSKARTAIRRGSRSSTRSGRPSASPMRHGWTGPISMAPGCKGIGWRSVGLSPGGA